MFFSLLIVALILCNVLRIQLKKVKSKEPPDLPGRIPIVGHGFRLLGNSIQMLQSLIDISEEATKYFDGVATLYMGFRKVYDPDDILTVMNSCLDKGYFHKYTNIFLGNGLLVADAANWKKSRKMLNPAFNQQILDGFINVFNSRAELLMKQFSEEVGKQFNHEDFLRNNNLGTICINLFGIDVEEPEYIEIFKKYVPLLMSVERSLGKRIQKFWQYSDFIYSLSLDKKKVVNQIEQLDVLAKLMISKKKHERKMFTDMERMYGKELGSKSFIDLLLSMADEGLSDEQVLSEANTIIVAGHETVASTLTFLIAELGSHPEIQEKAYEEIVDVLGDTERPVSKEDISKLVYMEAIIKETSRLYTVSLIYPRTVVRDVQLKNYTLKAGNEAVAFVYQLHRHSMWGPDADKFRPERWFDKDCLPDPKYYGGFGLGRRNCIGKTYAMMSMKIILTHMIRKYRISSDASKIVTKMNFLVTPHTGHEITLELRNEEKRA